MKHLVKILASVAIMVMSVSVPSFANDNYNEHPIENYSYRECLRDGMQASRNFTVDDIRSLCKEITAIPELQYIWSDGDMLPKNDYTKCYEKEMDKRNDDKDKELVKLICFYGLDMEIEE